MDLTWLEDFVALVECRNFSRAAKKRNLTQPAFSRRVRALESWVGAPLFDRGTHRIELTPAGEEFRAVAEDLLRRLQQGRQQALDASRAAASALRFAVTYALSLTFFPGWMRTLEARLGQGPIELIADNMQACERIMLEGQAHFLMCHHHPAAWNRLDPRDFTSVHLGDDVLIPVAARDRRGKPRHVLPGRPDAPVPYLAFSETSGMGRILTATRALEQRPVWLKPVFTSHLAVMLKTLAADGRGIAFTSRSLVADDLAPGGALARAGDESWDIGIEIRLYRPRARLNATAEKFWTTLRGA